MESIKLCESITEERHRSDHDRTDRNGRLTEQAFTRLAQLFQEAEQDRIHGRVGVEADFQGGVIQRIFECAMVQNQPRKLWPGWDRWKVATFRATAEKTSWTTSSASCG